jgi:hypothetical protein
LPRTQRLAERATCHRRTVRNETAILRAAAGSAKPLKRRAVVRLTMT